MRELSDAVAGARGAEQDAQGRPVGQDRCFCMFSNLCSRIKNGFQILTQPIKLIRRVPRI